MTVKVLTLITGEQLICSLSEVIDNDKPICLLMQNPYVIKLIPSVDVNEEGQPTAFTVNYTKWMPCSADNQFRIGYNSVVCVGDPDPQIADTYMSKFGALFNDGTDNGDALPASDSGDSPEESGVSDSAD